MTTPGPTEGDAVGAFVVAAFERLLTGGEDVHANVERDDGVLTRVAGHSYFTLGPLDRAALNAAIGSVVDLGCGAGRHGVALVERGFEYRGVDASAGCVAVCREQGLEAICETADSFLSGGSGRFDTVLLMGNNIGLAGRRANLGAFVGQLFRVLRPGGRVVATSTVDVLGLSDMNMAYRAAKERATGYEGDVEMRLRFRNVATPWFSYGYFTPVTLEGTLDSHGFHCEPPVVDGKHYLIVGHRP